MVSNEAERFGRAELRKVVIGDHQVPLVGSEKPRRCLRRLDALRGDGVTASAQLVENQVCIIFRVLNKDETERLSRRAGVHLPVFGARQRDRYVRGCTKRDLHL